VTRVVLHNGFVYTAASQPTATAICLDGPVVAWVGTEPGSRSYLDGADEVIDLQGQLITPAFVDAHVHLAQTGLAANGVDLSGAGSLAAALDRLRRYARTSDGLILGYGWDETHWPESRPFSGAEVDRAVGHRPAYLARVDVHSAVVSSALAAKAPELTGLAGWCGHGRVERVAHHRARDIANASTTPGQRRDAIEHALRSAAANGIGAVHELGAPHLSRPEDFALIGELTAQLAGPKVFGYWGELGGLQTARELGCLGAAGDLCADGAIGSRTAALLSPYRDGDQGTAGHLYLSREQVADHVLSCTRAGLQAGFHAIGDRSVSTVVAGLCDAEKVAGRSTMVASRHRLEHVEMISPPDIARLARLGVVASVQPTFDAWWGGESGLYATRLGEDRSALMNPFASMRRAGVSLAFGSDTPVTPFDPWGAVRAAVWHHTETERMTIEAAMQAHTRGGWCAVRDDRSGVLAPGESATYAVWETAGEPGPDGLPDLSEDAKPPRCLRTVVDGRQIFALEGAPA
jgi:predicted amidohydrolase YtcJ